MIESINNYKKISSTMATGGQPDEDELHEISKAEFDDVWDKFISSVLGEALK